MWSGKVRVWSGRVHVWSGRGRVCSGMVHVWSGRVRESCAVQKGSCVVQIPEQGRVFDLNPRGLQTFQGVQIFRIFIASAASYFDARTVNKMGRVEFRQTVFCAFMLFLWFASLFLNVFSLNTWEIIVFYVIKPTAD